MEDVILLQMRLEILNCVPVFFADNEFVLF